MGKCCCAPGCSNRFTKNCGLSFYCFPVDKERRANWVAAVGRKNWEPTIYSWLCSAHFVSGAKSNNKLSPDFVPSLFTNVDSRAKRRAESSLMRYERAAKRSKLRREAQQGSRERAAGDSSLVENIAAPCRESVEPRECLAASSLETNECTTPLSEMEFSNFVITRFHLR